MTPYRVAIVGSRHYPRMELVRQCIDRLAAHFAARGRGLVVVSGTEPTPSRMGYCVDSEAIAYARQQWLETDVCPADWKGQGKKAGPERNTTIVDRCDNLVAFWTGSRGTADVLRKAIVARKLAKVYDGAGMVVEYEHVVRWVAEVLDTPKPKAKPAGPCFLSNVEEAMMLHGEGSKEYLDAMDIPCTCLLPRGHKGPHQWTFDGEAAVEVRSDHMVVTRPAHEGRGH